MDRGSRSELLKTIENQKDKIQKYENKLRDLISAYKGVINEKEALEASVKALVASQSVPSTAPKRQPKAKPSETEGQESNDGQDEEDGPAEEDDHEVLQLRDQLSTLTTSLATLTQEKSKLETSFLTDKKIIRQELEEKFEEIERERNKHDEIVEQLTQDMQEWKNRLRSQQHEREREHSDHAMMLRELQKLLAEERSSKEAAEHQIDELKEEFHARSATSDVNTDHYQRRIQELTDDLSNMRKEMRRIEEHSLQPSPEFLELEKEMLQVKTEHQYMLQKELMNRSEQEAVLDRKCDESEERASSLEAKVSHLSDMIGDYERGRTQDQKAMAKLKERVSQLVLENTALAQATSRSASIDQAVGGVDNQSDVETILDKMSKLKDMLMTANERSTKPVNIEEVLHGGLGAMDPDALHRKCTDDYEQLREEFERYKLRAQSVLKSKNTKESSPHVEVDAMKTQITEFKDRLYQLRTDYEDQSKLLRTKEDTFRMSLTTLQEKHAEEFTNQRVDFKQRMTDIDVEMRRHRDRTITLLAEKDRELENLRLRLPDHLETKYISTYRQMSGASDPGEIGASSEEEVAVGHLLSRSALHGAPAESTLLHFAQEQSRKEVEVQHLRKQKHAVEMGLRELQQATILKEQRYLEQIDLLKEEIRKYERNISRESANLEYLKNVVYHFMVCADLMGKQGTLNAIATILQFSPREKERVQTEIKSGWWNYVNAQAQKAKK